MTDAIQYGQCWEDADCLLEALDVSPGDRCLSIASAGDNTLALLTRDPGHVTAVDLNPAQLACLQLRIAAYRTLAHGELLELMGSRASDRRRELYRRCRGQLDPQTREFWDAWVRTVQRGIGSAGRLERYFALFRSLLLPLVHSQQRVTELLAGGPRSRREMFFRREWNTPRWRFLLRLFASRALMSRLGRQPQSFRYVSGGTAARLLERTRRAFVSVDPNRNPYLQWLLTGRHVTALPLALRPEHFETIRDRLDRVQIWRGTIQDYLGQTRDRFDCFNLSNVFEYMPSEEYRRTLLLLVSAARSGSRLAYWNLFVPRSRPPEMADRIRPLDGLANRLYAVDKVFFYEAFVVEEVM